MIPNIFHFCFIIEEGSECLPFSLIHYLAIKSAYELNKPDIMYLYYKVEPKGEWWERSKKYLTLVNVDPPEEIFGNKIYHIAHKCDIIRLRVLIEHGGVYLDIDTICKKPFADLLRYNFVMGKQGKWRNIGLGNSVILSEKNSEFANEWLKTYKSFRSKGWDKYWDEHSCFYPKNLAKQLRDKIHIVEYNRFYHPLYYPLSLKKLFKFCYDYKNAYCHHLWQAVSWKKYLKNLTIKDIKFKDTTYNIIARRFL